MKTSAVLRRCLLLLAVSSLAASGIAQSQKHFLTVDELADSREILPEPPAENSAQFAYDEAQYQWGKSIRDTPRGKMAVSDADLSEGWIGRVFSEPFGYEISAEKTPEIYKLLKGVERDAGSLSARKAKKHYMRKRPFMVHNELTSTPDQEEGMRTNGSYPSGHTARGWSLALVLAELNPDRQEEILKRGFEYGQSRVIVGAHWQSDVDMGRIVSAAGVARLHADDDFNSQLLRAKAEVRALKGETCGCGTSCCE